VIHALSGEQDLRNMGGLRKKTPITFWTLVAASLAISGIPPFAGFYSKDEILASAYHYQPWMYWVGVITAGMTAFYVFRALFLAFFGDYRGKAHPHESPLSMTGPLMVLGVLSFIGGFTFKIPQFLEPLFPESKVPDEVWLMPVSVSFGVIGIAIAYTFYVWKPGLADSVSNAFGGLYKLVYNKYFVDEVYNATVVQPLVQGSRTVLWRGVDVGIIDGIVNGVGARSKGVGGILKLIQGGNVRAYAAWVVFGCVLLLLAIGFGGGVR
jgi:NADH-quinone oxidoreductase subunit L